MPVPVQRIWLTWWGNKNLVLGETGEGGGSTYWEIFPCGKGNFFSRWEECENIWLLAPIPPVVWKILDDLTYLRWFDDIHPAALACIPHWLLSQLPHNSFSYLLQKCQLLLKKLLSVIEINQLQFCEMKLQELVGLFELFHFLSMPAQGYGNFEKLPNTLWKNNCLTHRSPGIQFQTIQSLEKMIQIIVTCLISLPRHPAEKSMVIQLTAGVILG